MSGKTEARAAPQSDRPDRKQQSAESMASGEKKRSELARYLVSELMQGEREVILEHRGQDYRLRITEAGKLILSK
jgi:hemin uptake protein HemP